MSLRPIKKDARNYFQQKRGNLVQMNLSPVTLPEKPVCESCGGLGMFRYDVPVGHPQFGRMYACDNPDCAAAAEIKFAPRPMFTNRAGVPRLYKATTFQTFYDLPHDLQAGKLLGASCALSMAQNAKNGYWYNLRDASKPHNPTGYMNCDPHPVNWLVLWGPYGVGKTGLAASLVNWLSPEFASTFYRADDMFSEIQAAYSNKRGDGPNSDQVVDSIKQTPFLVIDELNMTPTLDKIRLIERIIRYRGPRDLPTVITCNVDRNEFREMWGQRTSEIVDEKSYWVHVGGKRLRHRTPDVESF